MAPLSAEHSPAVLALLARGKAGRDAFASALSRLGARGWLQLAEKADCRLTLSLSTPADGSADRLPEDELWLLGALRGWSKSGVAPRLDGLRDAVGRQALAEKALTSPEWSRVNGRLALPFFARLAVPSGKRAAARAAGAALGRFPDPDGDLPRTREEWDRGLAYAAAFGLAGGFLARAREANEQLARHFQGVVATFCTPVWYRECPNAHHERFAYLTGGLARALERWDWKEVDPA